MEGKRLRQRGRELGISWASMLPWVAIPLLGPFLAKIIMLLTGYRFVQILPFRFTSIWLIKLLRIDVRLIEPAWNPTTLKKHLRSELGAEGDHTTWFDIILFGSPEASERLLAKLQRAFPEAKTIGHEAWTWERNLTEVHLGMFGTGMQGMPPEQVLGHLFYQCKINWRTSGRKWLALDFRHIRGSWHNGTRVPNYMVWLQRLLPYADTIHVQAESREEWGWFIAGTGAGLLNLVTESACGSFAGNWVIEFDPRTGAGIYPRVTAKKWVDIINPILLVWQLRQIRLRTEKRIAAVRGD